MASIGRQLIQRLYGHDIWDGFRPSRPDIDVQGWNGDHPSLQRLASLPAGSESVVIDVGVWKGQSTITMANAIKRSGANGCVIAVDTFLGSPEHWSGAASLFARNTGMPDLYNTFLANVYAAGLTDYIIPLPQTSASAAIILGRHEVSAAIVHIDASHEYDEVLRDAAAYWALLRPGGYLIGDDYHETWPGVIKAAVEFSTRVGRPLAVEAPKWILQKSDAVMPPAPAPAAPSPRDALPALASRGRPPVTLFTAAQKQLLGPDMIDPGHLVIAEFRFDLHSRPSFYVQDPVRMPEPRGPASLEYIDDLITNYLLHPDYFYYHLSPATRRGQSRYCLIQISDAAQNPVNMTSIRALPRFRLCRLAGPNGPLHRNLDAKLSAIVQARDPGEAERIREMANAMGLLAPFVPHTEFLKYRYQIDIDGHSNAWGFLLKLAMGSCVLKVSSAWRQWYYDELRAWEHYVPVAGDLSNLAERIAWCLDNDAKAEEIAANGLKFANTKVFGPEMLAAARRLLDTSRECR